MIDIHSHIIPGIDDGAKAMDMALNMLKMAEKSGTKKIVATPHFMRGRFDYEYDEITEEIEKLKAAADENRIDIEIYQGQEIYYSSRIIEYYNEGIIATINKTRYMLIEFPMLEFDLHEIVDRLYELQIKGIVPIIAHPERYKMFIKKPSLINKMIAEGYLFQMNTGSLTGQFGKDVKKTAEIYLENRIYNFIGSDAHRDSSRSTDMSEFLKIAGRDDVEFFNRCAEDMLDDMDVKFEGSLVKERKKIFGIF